MKRKHGKHISTLSYLIVTVFRDLTKFHNQLRHSNGYYNFLIKRIVSIFYHSPIILL